MKTLVVDDSALARMMLKSKLRKLIPNICVDEAANGRDALLAIETNGSHYDMVFLDYNMSDMNGIEVLQEIRKETEDLPVIMVSANVQDKIKEEATRFGCTEFINKTTEDANLPRILGIE